MSLLAEEVVEEWLNRQGYFTIRGIKLGVDEIDLLAIKPKSDGSLERRHVEVQASVRPMSYISRVPKEVQRTTGRSPNSVKRSDEELAKGVEEWVTAKFRKPAKAALRAALSPGEWTTELVVHNVKSESELALIAGHGVTIHRLAEVVSELRRDSVIQSASGGNLLDLIHLSAQASVVSRSDVQLEAEIIASNV